MSAHLPIYLWGPGARRALAAARTGYQLVATAHATSVDEFVYSLASSPMRAPAEEIAAIHLLALLDAWLERGAIRREVRAIVTLSAGSRPAGVSATPLASRVARGGPLELDLRAAQPLFARLGADPAALAGVVETRAAGLVASAAPAPGEEGQAT